MIRTRLPGGDLWKYYLGFALARIGTVAVLVVVAQMLGPERYGFFEASVSVMLAAMIVGDAGVGAAVVRFADEAADRGAVLHATAQIQLIASGVAFLVFLVPVLVLAPPDAAIAVVALALLSFAFVEGFGALGAGVLRARADNAGYLRLAVLRLVTGLGVGAAGAEIGGAGGALFGVALAGLGFAVIGVAPLLQRSGAAIHADRRRILLYSLPLMLSTLSTWTLSLSDRVFLRIFSTPVELAQYAASYRTGSVVALFVSAPLALAWLPYARAAEGPGTLSRATTQWSLGLAWCALGGGALLVLLSPVLVPLLFGAGFDARPSITAAVVVSGWLWGLYFLVSTDVMLRESTRATIPVVVAVVVLNLMLNLVLVPVYDGGGAAVATLLSYLAMPLFMARVVPRDARAWLRAPAHGVVLALLLAAIGAAVVEPLAIAVPLVLAAVLTPRAVTGR
jgi:O-antigen/teichoic acid export membrane protein